MTEAEVDAVMQTIPAGWKERWCGGEEGPCACMGCVQIGNRLVMAGKTAAQVDPERIDERRIPGLVYQRYKVTKAEWTSWMQRRSDAR